MQCIIPGEWGITAIVTSGSLGKFGTIGLCSNNFSVNYILNEKSPPSNPFYNYASCSLLMRLLRFIAGKDDDGKSQFKFKTISKKSHSPPLSFFVPQVLTKYIPIQCVCWADTRYNSHDSDWLILCSSEPFSQNRSFFFCIQYSNYGIQTKADYCWGLGPDNNLKKDVEIGLGSGNRRKCRLFIGFLMFGGVFQ